MFLWFIPLILVESIQSLRNKAWYRKQPDRDNWERYQDAKRAYSDSLETWIMMQESWWQSLDGREFESRLAELLTRLGYLVIPTGKSGDGGIDLILARKRGEDTITIIVQCKAHKSAIGPAAVRDLYGTLVHGGQREAWLISSAGFSTKAFDFAKGKPLRLISIDEILRTPGIVDSP